MKSNPSKRHRDRLNGELDRLTGLLPFSVEVRARLDKLSVLRLSVGYLKVKSFFSATLKKQNGSSWTSERSLIFGGNVQNSSSSSSSSTTPPSQVSSIDGVTFSEGDLLLQALSGFVMVVTAEGYVFYTSPTIQDYLGFHQSDVVHQSVFELIHTDDRALFRRQLHFALNPNTSQQDGGGGLSDQSSAEISSNVVTYDPQNIPPENSSFLERNFCCRFRCLLDNSSGFLALNFRGRLKFIHGQNRVSEAGVPVPPQLALFCIATQMQPPSILEIRTKTLIFQTKHKLDFTPMGIDSRGKVVLGYNEVELCMKGSGYNFIHAADMMYCADNHLRMMKTGESGFTVFRLLAKTRTWIWVQANARLVFKAGKPDFIVARQRALINEEGEDQLRLRRLQLPFNFTTGEALLYDIMPTVDPPPDPCSAPPDPCSAPKQRKLDERTVSRESVLGCMLGQDQSLYCDHNKNNAFNTIHDAAFKDSHATLSVHRDDWEAPAAGSGAVKPEATVQDMLETLQQILGENDLSEVLDVDPEELKSWESTLLKMSSGHDAGENLDDILGNDILTYVEEQLQREGGLKPPVSFGRPPGPLTQMAPAGGPLGPVTLTHMDLPPLGFNGLQLGPASVSGTFDQLRPKDGCGLFSLHDRAASAEPDPGFQGSQWESNPAGTFVETYQNISSSPSLSCVLRGRCASPPAQGPPWSLDQQPVSGARLHQAAGCHRNPAHAVNSASMFRTPEAPSGPFLVQQGAEPSSCMFGPEPVNGVHLGLGAAPPSCFYRGRPGGGSAPGITAVPEPDEAAPSCQVAACLDRDGLLVQNQYLSFSQQMQITQLAGGFPFSSLPTGNAYYSENQYEPAGTSRNQYGPAGTSRDQYEPAGTSINQQGPVWTNRDQPEPAGTSRNQYKPV
ncbi:aryl hydrocarbon receptor-like isoform X2 [Clinocottus analis]